MPETHKLSVILFADIADYTAMMQKNEQQALLLLNRFKEVLKTETPRHHGRIIQYFGDGCLLSFESSTDGVDCAIALQKTFSTSPEVPVRIGIHLGEVVFKENNVFGDGVNIASRIESLGIPGAILLSKTVRDQIKNKTDFLLVSLGSFEFKNVEEPIEVFALANPGFVVPKREEMRGKLKEPVRKKRSKWFIPAIATGILIIVFIAWLLGRSSSSPLSEEAREKPVAIMAFQNQTGDEKLDAFGLMAMDWISQKLMESGKAHVIKIDQRQQDEKNETTIVPKGAELIIKGRYYNQDNEKIATVAEIADAKTNAILYALKPVSGIKDSIMTTLAELQQQILGYWVLNKRLLGKKPPRYDAYEAYLKAASYEGTDIKKAEFYYKEASKLDPDFNYPLFWLIPLANNSAQPKLRDSVVALLEKKASTFTDYEKLHWGVLKAGLNGDFERSAELGWQLYEQFHIESGATGTISDLRAKNHLHKTIERYRVFKPVEFKPEDSYIGQLSLSSALEALCNLSQYDSVLAWIGRMNYPLIDGDIALVHVRALTALHQMNQVKIYLEKYKNMKLEQHGYYWSKANPYWKVCVELFLHDRSAELPEYLNMFEKEVLDEPASIYYYYYLGIIAYLRGDYTKAYDLAMKHDKKGSLDAFSREFPAVCLIKMGRTDKAREWIQELTKKGSAYPGQLNYAIGVIKANLGEKEEAVNYLRKAFNEGYDFDYYCYREDFQLKTLFDYKPFMEFTEPK